MKKISAAIFVLFTCLLMSVYASAAGLSFETTGSLSDAKAYTDYSDTIEMTDGNENYVFSFASGYMPQGLTISSNGAITGQPTVSGFFVMYIKIADKNNLNDSVVKEFTMYISPRPVRVKITAPEGLVYTGNPYTADIVVYDMATGAELTEVNAEATYILNGISSSSAVNAGNYYINVSNPRGCIIKKKTGDTAFTIERASVSVTVDAAHMDYDGTAKPIPEDNIHINPQIDYQVDYKPSTGTYTASEPVMPDEYTVRVHTTDPNYEIVYAYNTLTIEGKYVNFTVENNVFTYDENNTAGFTATLTPSIEGFSDYSEEYYKMNGDTVGEKVSKITDAGTYKIVVKLGDNSEYLLGTLSSDTITVNPKEILFTVNPTEFTYTGEAHTLSVVTAPELDESNYTVEYHKSGESAASQVKDIGSYDVVVNITNPNYTKKTGSTETVEVVQRSLVFEVTDINSDPYDNTSRVPTITPKLDGTPMADALDLFDVTYVKDGTSYAAPIDAGTYTITITPKENSPYLVDSVTPNTLNIPYKDVKFTVTPNSFDYTGETFDPTVSTDPVINTTLYSVEYRKQGEDTESPIKDVGTYDVVITLNKNYKQTDDSTKQVTVNAVSGLNYGNTPMGLAKAFDKANGNTDTVDYLITNGTFNPSNLPTGVVAGIKYGGAEEGNGNVLYTDWDKDEYGIMARSLDDILDAENNIKSSADPGCFINDETGERTIYASEFVTTGEESPYGKMIYIDGSTRIERNVYIIGKTGDINGDGYINAVDANKLRKMKLPITVYSDNGLWSCKDSEGANISANLVMSVYDVNNDGTVNNDDVNAILNRFSNKIIQRYPWL